MAVAPAKAGVTISATSNFKKFFIQTSLFLIKN